MEFNFKRCFSDVLGIFAYPFVCCLLLGIFTMLVWFAYRFIDLGVSFLEYYRWELTLIGLIGSFAGFCFGSLLRLVRGIKCKNNQDTGRLS